MLGSSEPRRISHKESKGLQETENSGSQTHKESIQLSLPYTSDKGREVFDKRLLSFVSGSHESILQQKQRSGLADFCDETIDDNDEVK